MTVGSATASWIQASESFAPPPLAADAMHVWPVALETERCDLAALQRTLAPDELDRARRFRFARDQRRFTVCRAALRRILGAYLDEASERVQFQYSELGKPSLAGSFAQSEICFNVSHSDAMALVAVIRGRDIGVDIEHVRLDLEFEQIARNFFSGSECAALNGLSPELKPLGFFQCWTRKEAFIKAIGQGLSFPLHQFDVSLGPHTKARLLATRPDCSEAARWSFLVPTIPRGYVGAAVVKAPEGVVSCWTGETLC